MPGITQAPHLPPWPRPQREPSVISISSDSDEQPNPAPSLPRQRQTSPITIGSDSSTRSKVAQLIPQPKHCSSSSSSSDTIQSTVESEPTLPILPNREDPVTLNTSSSESTVTSSEATNFSSSSTEPELPPKRPWLENVVLTEATDEDVPELAKILEYALEDDPVLPLVCNAARGSASRSKDILYQYIENPAVQITKVVQTRTRRGISTEIIVGFAIFSIVDSDEGHSAIRGLWKDLEENAGDFGWRFWRDKRKIWRNFMKGKSFMYCECVVVLPQYQDRGVGSLLLQYELRLAIEEDIPLFITVLEIDEDEIPPGHNLFEQLGFVLFVEHQPKFPGEYQRRLGRERYIFHTWTLARSIQSGILRYPEPRQDDVPEITLDDFQYDTEGNIVDDMENDMENEMESRAESDTEDNVDDQIENDMEDDMEDDMEE